MIWSSYYLLEVGRGLTHSFVCYVLGSDNGVRLYRWTCLFLVRGYDTIHTCMNGYLRYLHTDCKSVMITLADH